MPSRMANEGVIYNWTPAPIVGRNGRGRAVQAGYPSLFWGWSYLSDAEWDWWVTTVLAGAIDAEITGTTQLYDDDKVERTISSCVVTRPTHETIRYGYHYNVRILIDRIVVSA